MIRSILLPVDGSEFCKRSYKLAVEIARKYSAKITIVHVRRRSVQRDSNYGFYQGANVAAIRDVAGSKDAVKILKKARGYFSMQGVHVETKLIEGEPAQAIIEYAQKGSYDAIIMCTHGMGGLKRFTMGSITSDVVINANVPVLVVRCKSGKVIDIEEERAKRLEQKSAQQ